MSNLKIQAKWVGQASNSPVAASAAKLSISLGNQNLTAYTGEDTADADYLEIPTIFLAEWLAENWWALLWEPRKSDEDSDDPDYASRHSTVFADNGFALPDLRLSPIGDEVEVRASRRRPKYAGVRFKNAGLLLLPRKDVESELKSFASSLANRLESKGISGSLFQEYWALILSTTDAQQNYCRMIGALGLSPYVENDNVDQLLTTAVEALGESAVMDLCLAATQETLRIAVREAGLAIEIANRGSHASLGPMAGSVPPPDNLTRQAWQRGVAAAQRVREAFQISEKNPMGGREFLDRLGIDTTNSIGAISIETENITGAIVRNDDVVQFGLIQPSQEQRRFAAARGFFAAWSSGRKEAHLLTPAITRDQQANRAFAAELMAPIAFIRSRIRTDGSSNRSLEDMASELGIRREVVVYQAKNNGFNL